MAVVNPPGRSALDLSSDGTHSAVLARMLADLPTRLPTLVVRTGDDPAVALLDSWATVADVVTFYQERIGNEGYLRTATEQRSVRELARAIGYELRPGVAAGTWLDVRMETAPGAPTSAVVPAGTPVRSIPGQGELSQVFETDVDLVADVARNEVPLRRFRRQRLDATSTSARLAGVSTGLRPGDAILVVDEPVADPRTAGWRLRLLRTVSALPATAPDVPSVTVVTWDEPLGVDPVQPRVYALRVRAAAFGYNAPDWRTLPDSVRARYQPTGEPAGDGWPGFTLLVPGRDSKIDLAEQYPELGVGSWLVLEQPGLSRLYQVRGVSLSAREDYAISAKTTFVTLDSATDVDCFGIRQVVVYTGSEPLELADEPVGGGTAGPELTLDRPAPIVAGQPVIVTGTAADGGAAVVEVAHVDRVRPGDDGTIAVTLREALNTPLAVDSARVLGNVVPASHGETVAAEVLGSGDGATGFQRFTLRKPELTHLPAATPRGVVDTLVVRVDTVRWAEVPSLFAAGPTDRAYVVRIDDQAAATVVFGDGQHGSRLPSGQENVVAAYRSGIGPDGNVAAGALTLLPRRPLGVAAVTNPLPASGGTAPEQLAQARTNAPLTVLTLDRVVSLRDYEDYARAYGGIAKARAVALRDGRLTVVHLTVAGPGGATVSADTVANLLGALDTVRDRAVPVRIVGYVPTAVTVGAQVLTDPDRRAEDVHDAVRSALVAGFAVDRRAFGQPVTAAEILTMIQQVPGVVAARLTDLHRADQPPPPGQHRVDEVIVALDARLNPTGSPPVLPAELLLTDAAHLTVEVLVP
ncbi:putative baseplate assembly protein [Micromonospora rubida]|uniref:Baseplate assembly protein n=1 Tax=Micromonospora rubida TaxID=2697657 RepID=A0ABW7SLZ9_9ACTN